MQGETPETTMDLLFLGLDHGVESVRASGGPLTPFVIVERSGERQLIRFSSDTLESATAQGVSRIRATHLEPGDCAVLVYDGYLTTSEGRLDAIYAEAVDDAGRVTVVAQRYKPKSRLRSFETVGNAALLPDARGKL